MMSSFVLNTGNFETKYAYAGCAAPFFGPSGPCFDLFTASDLPFTERTIMENLARNIELNYGDWQMSDRKWDDEDASLQLPAIICTEFVADDMKQYRMAKWVDLHKISSFEDHRDDSLCDKWLPPIDDGVKIRWDKPSYLSDNVGIVKVNDSAMNQDDKKIDTFDIHVWSDIDHKGIELTVTETDIDGGIFEGMVFFTTADESSGTMLLVEDAVYAEHKSSVNFSRITNEYEASKCAEGTRLIDGVCEVIDNGCEPDLYGNIYCKPKYDYLQIILSEPYALLFVFGTPLLIAGIVIGVIILRKRK